MTATDEPDPDDACPDCGAPRRCEVGGEYVTYIKWTCGRVADNTGRVSRACGGELLHAAPAAGSE